MVTTVSKPDTPTSIVVLCGSSRAGKSSLIDVVFRHRPAASTLFIKPTLQPKLMNVTIGDLFEFSIVELPTHLILDTTTISMTDVSWLSRASTVLIVLDCQELVGDFKVGYTVNDEALSEELEFCKSVIERSKAANKDVTIDIFLHKMDGSSFAKPELRSDFQKLVANNLTSLLGQELKENVMLFSTSLYDTSAREASSHVIQRMMPQTRIVGSLLDILVENCAAHHGFLLDYYTRLMIAVDSSGFDPSCYELCSDLLDLMAATMHIRNSYMIDQSTMQKCSVVLDNGFTLQLVLIHDAVAVGLILKESAFVTQQHIVNENVQIFIEAMDKGLNLYKHLEGKGDQ